jgi:hypothetical protein
MNVKDNFVPYKIALELKKLGFDEPCLKQGNPHGHTMWRFGCTDDENDTLTIKDIISQKLHEDFIGIPLYQSVQNWLLEKHGIWVTIDGYYSNISFKNYFTANVSTLKNIEQESIEIQNSDKSYFNNPQEALNSAFEYCLKNLIK